MPTPAYSAPVVISDPPGFRLTRFTALSRQLHLGLLAGLLLIGLAGCGGGAGAGGSGNNDAGNSPPLGSGGQDPLPAETGFLAQIVNAADNSAAFIAQANEQGQQGFRYSSGRAFGTTVKNVFIDDLSSPSQFSHKALEASTTVGALLTQANEQGALGFRFRGNLAFDAGGNSETVALYTSDSSVNATYDYEALAPEDTLAGRESQFKSQGARGYRFIADFDFGGTTTRSLYARDTSSDVTYDYIVQTAATTANSFLSVANLQGGNGYRFRSNISLANNTAIGSIFVMSSAGGTFEYSLSPAPGSTEIEFLEQFNAQGAEQKLLQTELVFGSTTQALYVDLSNCQCQTLRVADPFTD